MVGERGAGMSEEHKRQIELAFAEAAAAQLLLVNLMRELRTVVPTEIIKKAFDETIDDLTITSVMAGSPDRPTHNPETLRIVEELRKIVFTRQDKPKRAV
jgi:hypothetical protein